MGAGKKGTFKSTCGRCKGQLQPVVLPSSEASEWNIVRSQWLYTEPCQKQGCTCSAKQGKCKCNHNCFKDKRRRLTNRPDPPLSDLPWDNRRLIERFKRES